MQIRYRKCFILALASAASLTLAGCGKPDHIDLAGLKLGMTQAEVQAAAPSGAVLYCGGDGDDAFDRVAGMPKSTTLRYCTWAIADPSTGQRTFAQVAIGADTSSKVTLVFDYAGNSLQSVNIEVTSKAYDRVVKTLSDKLGSPDSSLALPGFFGSTSWDSKYDTLTVGIDQQRQYITDVFLEAKRTKSN